MSAPADTTLIPRPSFMSRLRADVEPAQVGLQQQAWQHSTVQPPPRAAVPVAGVASAAHTPPPLVEPPVASAANYYFPAPAAAPSLEGSVVPPSEAYPAPSHTVRPTALPLAVSTPSIQPSVDVDLAAPIAVQPVPSPTHPFAGLAASATTATALVPPSPPGRGGPFQLERRPKERTKNAGSLDIVAVVLAIVLPPIGLVTGIVAALRGSGLRDFASAAAKAAIIVGAVLTVVVGTAAVVVAKVNSDDMSHAAISASSAKWCTRLTAAPETLQSPTLNWPAPADTINDSLLAIHKYVEKWQELEKLAPAGIEAGTTQIANEALAIHNALKSTRTLVDSENVSQMQAVVAKSGVPQWAAQYCK